MKVELNLTIERWWFLEIEAFNKREEYRDLDNRQVRRVFRRFRGEPDWLRSFPVILLRNGYRMDSPAIARYITYIDLRNRETAKHREWGEPMRQKRPHFVIGLGSKVASGTYAEVKAKLKELGAL